MDGTVLQGLAGDTAGNKFFSDLDYADDAAILSELLAVPGDPELAGSKDWPRGELDEDQILIF